MEGSSVLIVNDSLDIFIAEGVEGPVNPNLIQENRRLRSTNHSCTDVPPDADVPVRCVELSFRGNRGGYIQPTRDRLAGHC